MKNKKKKSKKESLQRTFLFASVPLSTKAKKKSITIIVRHIISVAMVDKNY